MEVYTLSHTGQELNDACTNRVMTITQDEFDLLSPEDLPIGRLYIITDGDNINKLFRSNGTSKVLVGGGSGGGTTVTKITDVSDPALTGAARLAGITIGTSSYRVTHISIDTSNETLVIV